MTDFLQTLQFSFSVTGPIFLVLMLGIWLKRIGLLTDEFVATGSRLVFNVTLPSLLFISISKTHISEMANLQLVLYGVIATTAFYLLLEGLAHLGITPAKDRGVVVQASFRSNMGIIGLAYCVNAYGESGLVASALYLGIVTILYNILSVITLNRSLHNGQRNWLAILSSIARNPLIIGILLALPVSWLSIPIPAVLLTSGEYFAQMTLPLALLCTGASLSFRSMQQELHNTVSASLAKLILMPFLLTLFAIVYGFQPMEVGIVALFSCSPTATTSYVMTKSMGGNATLSANIIAVTTLGSVFTTSIAIVVLHALGMM